VHEDQVVEGVLERVGRVRANEADKAHVLLERSLEDEEADTFAAAEETLDQALQVWRAWCEGPLP
jgi:hypothetical protein